MPEYDNNLSGALFPADKSSERAPDFTGTAEIEGVEYRLAGWKRVSRNGKAFISLKFEDKAEFNARQAERLEDAEGADALDM